MFRWAGWGGRLASPLATSQLFEYELEQTGNKQSAPQTDGLFLPFARSCLFRRTVGKLGARFRCVCGPFRLPWDPSGRSLGSPIGSRAPQGPIVNTENGYDVLRRPGALGEAL